MSLHPTLAQAMWFAPAGSTVHLDAQEAERVAADLARNEAKNSGALEREEVDRAHRAEVAAGVHQ